MAPITRPPNSATVQSSGVASTASSGLRRVVTNIDPASPDYGQYFSVAQSVDNSGSVSYRLLDAPNAGQAYTLPGTGASIGAEPELVLIYSYTAGGDALPLTVTAAASGFPAYPALGQGVKCTVSTDGTNPIITGRVCNIPLDDQVIYRPETNPEATAANWVMSSLSELPIPVGTQFELPTRQAATAVTFRQLTAAELNEIAPAAATVAASTAQPIGQPILVDIPAVGEASLPTRPANAGAAYVEPVSGALTWRAGEAASAPQANDFSMVSTTVDGIRTDESFWFTDGELDTWRGLGQNGQAAQIKVQYWTARPAETTVQVTTDQAGETLDLVDLYVTTAGVIPAGARSISVNNMGENALGQIFHPWSLNNVQHPSGAAERSADSQSINASFRAIPYDPNPTGEAVPNTLWISYEVVV